MRQIIIIFINCHDQISCAFALIGPSLWHQLPPTTRSLFQLGGISSSFRFFKTALFCFFLGVSVTVSYWCSALRGFIQIYRYNRAYNTICSIALSEEHCRVQSMLSLSPDCVRLWCCIQSLVFSNLWEDETVRERIGHLSSYAKAKKMKSLLTNLSPTGHTSPAPYTSPVRNLGIIFDKNLTFADHITQLSRTCYVHICGLRRLCPILDYKTARTIPTSIVLSKLITAIHFSTASTLVKWNACKQFRTLLPGQSRKLPNITT